MSKYGLAAYGDGLYGSGITSVYDAAPLQANVVNTAEGVVRVSWRTPDGSYDRLVLLQGKYGIPDNPDREVSQTLLDIDYSSGSTDGERTRQEYFDSGLVPGREYFYAIYVRAEDSASVSGKRWFLAGSVRVLLSKVLNSAEQMRLLLPAAMFTVGGGLVSGPVEDFSLLYEVTDGLGVILDRVRTDSERLLQVYDTRLCPTALVPSMNKTLGIGSEVSLPARAQRALNANAARIFISKGTSESIRLMTESLSGMDAYPSLGANLLPSPFVSGFEIQDTDIVAGTLAAAPTTVSTMLRTATVSGRPGFPVKSLSDPAQLDAAPVLGTLTNSSGAKQHVVLLHKVSSNSTQSTWAYVPAAKGTGSPSFGSGSVLRVNHNGTGWSTSHGFLAEIETPGTGDPGDPPYDVVTDAEALFTPLMDYRLRVKRVATTIPEDLTIRFGPRHNILLAETYAGSDTLIVLEHPHSFLQGHRVTVACDQLSLSGAYVVTRVVDPHRITIAHQGTSYAAMNPATIGASTTNYVSGPDYARSVSIDADETYTFSAWVRSNAAATVTPRIKWYEPTMVLDSTSAPSPTTLVADTWTKVSVTATSPVGTSYASFEVAFGSLPVDGLAYMDNAQFELGSTTAKYSDGRNVVVQLATTIVTDPGGVLRLRLKDRLREVTSAGRTHTALLTEDESVTVAAGSYLSLPFAPVTRFFQNVDPDTVLTQGQDLTSLGLDGQLSYVPAYDPEALFRVGNQDLIEVLIRADVLATSTQKTVAMQKVEGGTGDVWTLSIQKASSTTATLTAVITNVGASAITLSGTVPYEDDISRWYRIRVLPSSVSGSLSDGAALGLFYAADSIAEPSSWTSVVTAAATAFRAPVPGEVRIGDTSGARVRVYRARVSRIAEFVGNDYDSVSKTAPNDVGAFESSQWSLVGP